MKAIETVYDGYRFRSRLEARWAVFFNTLGIKYEYEEDSYKLQDGTCYLPDFRLPEQDCFVEIKGQKPSVAERIKARYLSFLTGKSTFIFSGSIHPEQEAIEFEPGIWYLTGVDPISPCIYGEKPTCAKSYSGLDCDECIYEKSIQLPHDVSYAWGITENKYGRDFLHVTTIKGRVVMEDPTRYNQLEGMPEFRLLPAPLSKYEKHLKDILSPHPSWMYTMIDNNAFHHSNPKELRWYECEWCGKLDIQSPSVNYIVGLMCECSCDGDKGVPKNDTPRLIAAYTAARQARFEHGERG